MKIFSSVWLHECFGKYFLVFGYVPKNALKNHFYNVSHIFLGSKQILLQRIKIYKQSKKQKSKQRNKNQNKKIKIPRSIVREGLK